MRLSKRMPGGIIQTNRGKQCKHLPVMRKKKITTRRFLHAQIFVFTCFERLNKKAMKILTTLKTEIDFSALLFKC